MDLKDFIPKVINEIGLGIEKSQEGFKDSDTRVIPKRFMPVNEGWAFIPKDESIDRGRPVQILEFDVSVILDNKIEGQGNGSVKVVGLLELGAGGKVENNSQHHHRIKFKIPIAYSCT